jgi:hypothetical protein
MPENYFLVNGHGKGYITPEDALHVFRGAGPALSASAVLEVYLAFPCIFALRHRSSTLC